MFLEIVTPEAKLYEGEVQSVKVPGSKGEFQVLNNHAPIISSLAAGHVEYHDGKAPHGLDIDGGVIEVLNNRIILLIEGIVKAG